ncbi:MAG TPA: 2-oxoacid:acceptor oxidoreductase family protein [Armatimonadota bacterium]|jgi:2-oxoglutarate ferredoxin oxidoreductase subunit gamma|nr:2-oxoacid:acceptor oxidoreductase family protein [Armatimonadota bacterium]
MRSDVIFAGIGGQGLITMGQMLAVAAMNEGKMVSFLPSYSPEVRGGWANCTVVVSDRGIGSPTVGEPSAVVALESTAVKKHAPTVRPGGLLVINTSLAADPVDRDDVQVLEIAANEIALEMGNERVANSIMLGAYVAASGAVELQSVKDAVAAQLKKRPQLVEINMQALARGAEIVSA